jgi:hypothetical protein
MQRRKNLECMNFCPTDCICGDSAYDPVCAFGLTWKNKCDADCGGYSCPQTAGVCFYNPNGTFLATGPASSAAGGEPNTQLWRSSAIQTPSLAVSLVGLQWCYSVGRLLAGVKAAAADTSLPAAGSATYSYTEGLHKTLIFFESMRSGKLDRQRLAWYGSAAGPTAAIAPADCKGVAYATVGTPRWQHRVGPVQKSSTPQYWLQHLLTSWCMLRAGAATRVGTAWGQMARMSAAGTMRPAAPS